MSNDDVLLWTYPTAPKTLVSIFDAGEFSCINDIGKITACLLLYSGGAVARTSFDLMLKHHFGDSITFDKILSWCRVYDYEYHLIHGFVTRRSAEILKLLLKRGYREAEKTPYSTLVRYGLFK